MLIAKVNRNWLQPILIKLLIILILGSLILPPMWMIMRDLFLQILRRMLSMITLKVSFYLKISRAKMHWKKSQLALYNNKEFKYKVIYLFIKFHLLLMDFKRMFKIIRTCKFQKDTSKWNLKLMKILLKVNKNLNMAIVNKTCLQLLDKAIIMMKTICNLMNKKMY